MRHGFIVAQISLAFVLLTCAGLLGVSLQKVMSASPGFQAEHVLTGSISLPWKSYPDTAKRQAFLERLDAALRVQPGVTAVGFTSALPFAGNDGKKPVTVEGVQLAPGESARTNYASFAHGDY